MSTVKILPEETVFLGPKDQGRRVYKYKSPTEKKLLDLGVKPIRYIAGTEAKYRGQGKPSAEGNVYEVEYKGYRAIAKIVPSFYSNESEVWSKINKIKKSLPPSQSRHLPDIYDILKPDEYTDIIIMEVLQPTNSHISRVLRTDVSRSRQDLLNNEAFIHDSLKLSFDRALSDAEKFTEKESFDAFKMFSLESTWLRQKIEGDLIRSLIRPENISERIFDSLNTFLKMFTEEERVFVKGIADNIQSIFVSSLSVPPKPIAKYYSAKGIDYTLENMEKNNTPDVNMQALRAERNSSVYSERPEGFMYAEKHMPETKGIYSLLKTLKGFGIEWSDVHANNIMERPGTRELVLIDVGLFE